MYAFICAIIESLHFKGDIMLLTIEEIRNQLKDRNLKAVAKSSGVNYDTVRQVFKGRDPSYDVLVKLSVYLTGGAND